MIAPFEFARIPSLTFGPGTFEALPSIAGRFGPKVLVVTGAGSYRAEGRWDALAAGFGKRGMTLFQVPVDGEPSPALVDEAVGTHKPKGIDVVLAWGGGSVLDAGKAISAMLLQDGSVTDYLEGVGTGAVHDGRKVPMIAVPTTAGTGSEATKNAVLSEVGPGGFKKSLRHESFVPDHAVIDGRLMLSCPADVTAACGMDAFTQLLESFVSPKTSRMTETLAWSGLEEVAACLVRAVKEGETDLQAREGMAYAALMSGMTLANAGLGVVHGLASPMGGLFDIPHGVVCGTLIGPASAVTIGRLIEAHGPGHPTLPRYAAVGALIGGRGGMNLTDGCAMLVDMIDEWTETLGIPRLGAYGIEESDFDAIVAGAGSKNNPEPLGEADMKEILRRRL